MLESFAGIDGIKTGYTRASGFNLVTSLHRNGRHLIGVVFGGDSAASRNSEMRVLLTRMLTRASTVKTRKPMLLARLRAEPKLAQRPAVRTPNIDVAAASQMPKAFARPSPDAERINVLAEAPEPETPIQIFKVRAVPIVPKTRRPVPSPDETTDMEASEQPADLHPETKPSAGDPSSRSDFGRFAASPEPTLASELGERFSDASAATLDRHNEDRHQCPDGRPRRADLDAWRRGCTSARAFRTHHSTFFAARRGREQALRASVRRKINQPTAGQNGCKSTQGRRRRPEHARTASIDARRPGERSCSGESSSAIDFRVT